MTQEILPLLTLKYTEDRAPDVTTAAWKVLSRNVAMHSKRIIGEDTSILKKTTNKSKPAEEYTAWIITRKMKTRKKR